MSSKPWLESLRQALKSRQPPGKDSVRAAIVGIGSELRGDDAAGIHLVRDLQQLVGKPDGLLLIDAGPAPENTSGLLRRFGPDLVLLVDAAQMGEPPGSVCWLAWQDTIGLSASTHTLPIHMFATYLTQELGCEVALLGIQPAQNALDRPVSPVVAEAIKTTALALADVLAGIT